MIEEELKKLTAAIETLTGVMQQQTVSVQTKTPVIIEAEIEVSKPTAEPEPEASKRAEKPKTEVPAPEPEIPPRETLPESNTPDPEPEPIPSHPTQGTSGVTQDELKDLMRRAFQSVGGAKVMEVMQSFGKGRLTDFDDEQLTELKVKMEALVNG